MTDLELIFTKLGEASTTEIATRKDAQGFEQNKTAALAGGAVAGNARKELGKKSGTPVVSRSNYLSLPAVAAETLATERALSRNEKRNSDKRKPQKKP